MKVFISTKNSKLAKDGIVAIDMPPILSCPGAGECKKYCYACVGPGSWKGSMFHKLNNFNFFLSDPKAFEESAVTEIIKCNRRIFRWHSAGDTQSLEYLQMMVRIANHFPEIKFYTYTKSISIVLEFGWEKLLSNLKIIQSYGGKEDHLIEESKPFAKIFLNKESIPSDFVNVSDSDYRAATDATRLAIRVHGVRKKNFKPKE